MEISRESADGIRSRIALCKLAIELIEQAVDDPRREDALVEYRGQLARLEGRLAEVEAALSLMAPPPAPPHLQMAQMERGEDIVIGLKTARLFGKG